MQTLFASLLAVVTMAINAQSWKTTLPDMLFGMIGIFIVIGVIILVTYGLNKAFSKKKAPVPGTRRRAFRPARRSGWCAGRRAPGQQTV